MKLDPSPGPGMGLDARPGPRSPFLHFPDGNATLARLLVQRLIPRAVPGRTVDDVVVARTDYARLDAPGPARLRLNSTVVRARHSGDAARSAEVEVMYARDGRLERVRAGNCVLACWSSVRAQLTRILGAGGFEPARDVLALTVNRWPHGYAYQYNSLWDPFWIDGGPLPCVAARQRFGRIAIANADAAAYAYTDAAIDQAHRAVDELLGLPSASGAGAPLRVRTRTLRSSYVSSYVESCDETPGRWWPA